MHVPHGPLRDYYDRESYRHGWVRRLFDRTAVDYDRVERVMALGSGSWYRRRALARAGLAAGMRVADVGVGTGLTAREAARLVGPSGHVTGVDPSRGMMERAVLPPTVELLVGRAESIPLAPGSVDFVSMGYALRHVSDLSLVFQEFLRILRPGGRLCVLEITSPPGALSRAALKGYMRGVVPFMARCIGRHRDAPTLMRYYWDTIEACASPAVILNTMSEAGFIDVRRIVTLGIFSEYCAGKPSA